MLLVESITKNGLTAYWIPSSSVEKSTGYYSSDQLLIQKKKRKKEREKTFVELSGEAGWHV
jgi:hypothetical protein